MIELFCVQLIIIVYSCEVIINPKNHNKQQTLWLHNYYDIITDRCSVARNQVQTQTAIYRASAITAFIIKHSNIP